MIIVSSGQINLMLNFYRELGSRSKPPEKERDAPVNIELTEEDFPALGSVPCLSLASADTEEPQKHGASDQNATESVVSHLTEANIAVNDSPTEEQPEESLENLVCSWFVAFFLTVNAMVLLVTVYFLESTENFVGDGS